MNYFKSLLLFITFTAGISVPASKIRSMEFLPAMSRNIEHVQQEINQAKTCAICQEDFTVASETVRLSCNPDVPHIFHKNCLKPWIDAHNTCPTCRAPIQLSLFHSILRNIQLLDQELLSLILQHPNKIIIVSILVSTFRNQFRHNVPFKLKNLLLLLILDCVQQGTTLTYSKHHNQWLVLFGMAVHLAEGRIIQWLQSNNTVFNLR